MKLCGSFVDCCELIPWYFLFNLQQEIPSFYSKGALQKSPCLNGWTLKYSQMISPITVLMMPWWYGWMCNFFFFVRIAFQCQHQWMLWYLTKLFSIFNGLSDTVSKPEIDSSSSRIIQKQKKRRNDAEYKKNPKRKRKRSDVIHSTRFEIIKQEKRKNLRIRCSSHTRGYRRKCSTSCNQEM